MSKIVGFLDPQVLHLAETRYQPHYARQRQQAATEQEGGYLADVFYEDEPSQSQQVGEGPIGDLFRRGVSLLPGLASRGLGVLGSEALSGLRNLAGDFSQGANLKRSLGRRATEVGTSLWGRMRDRIRRMMGGRRKLSGADKRVLRELKLYSLLGPAAASGRIAKRRRRKTVKRKSLTKKSKLKSSNLTAAVKKRRRRRTARTPARSTRGRRRRTTRRVTTKRRRAPTGRRRRRRRTAVTAAAPQSGSGLCGGGWL